MKEMMKEMHILNIAFMILVACAVSSPASAGGGFKQAKHKDGTVTWVSGSGLKLYIKPPVLKGKSDVSAKLTSHAVTQDFSVSNYLVVVETDRQQFTGYCRVKLELPKSDKGNLMICDLDLEFDTPVSSDLTVEFAVEAQNATASQITLPEMRGKVKPYGLDENGSKAAYFLMGAGSAGEGEKLALPAVNVHFGKSQLAVATDPYFGVNFIARAKEVKLSYTYTASKVLLKSERRKFAFLFHDREVDGMLSNFYHTVPDIKPGEAWMHEIHLNYFDYFSKNGEGWYINIAKLAELIPKEYRKHTIVTIHGWYDYIGRYSYNRETKKLAGEWKIVETDKCAPDGNRREYTMTLADMHKRIRYAKDLGFRVAFYYGDGLGYDSGLPEFKQEWVVINEKGGRYTTWRPGCSIGQTYVANPSCPEVKQIFINVLRSQIEEFGREVDAFVWDETFYMPVGVVTKAGDDYTYADREYMYLNAELTKLVQSWQKNNPDLVFLTSDCLGISAQMRIGDAHTALVSHGTYEDTRNDPDLWPVQMLNNYRNCLMSCLWTPVSLANRNKIAAEYGIAQALSDGHGDFVGPVDMKPEMLTEVIDRFLKNVKDKKQRTKYLKDN
ncbi:MAG: hypothetical protein LBK58_05540 [Prevotellaceae bacterium]|jgi:hypothetical protein|nr:hypothetical protein [Prevotellaceae bacterium]